MRSNKIFLLAIIIIFYEADTEIKANMNHEPWKLPQMDAFGLKRCTFVEKQDKGKTTDQAIAFGRKKRKRKETGRETANKASINQT